MTQERKITISWDDPETSARDPKKISGLDYLTAIREGRVNPPPIARLTGYRIKDVDQGRAVFELEPFEYHYNPFSTLHGGISSTILDTAMTAAVLSTLPIGFFCYTVELKVNFVRPITIDTGVVESHGCVIHSGRNLATAEGRITDGEEKLYAHSMGTFAVMKAK
ncbi:MAG: PaaI family thioesterase [Proteobacteria bacterium]|nr:PaaI family thioesterase [Pseudomonadota bacterium]